MLTPGRYVGAEAVAEDGEPFEEKMTRLVARLDEQLAQGARLEKAIRRNLGVLGFTTGGRRSRWPAGRSQSMGPVTQPGKGRARSACLDSRCGCARRLAEFRERHARKRTFMTLLDEAGLGSRLGET